MRHDHSMTRLALGLYITADNGSKKNQLLCRATAMLSYIESLVYAGMYYVFSTC